MVAGVTEGGKPSQRIDMITSELQEAIMRTRMQPISNVFNKFTRVVRDLSKDLGKQIDLFIEGKDVELDKTIIEAINGWIKDELYYDYNYHKTDDLPKLINDYITYFNNDRLAYALNYKTPVQYKRDLGFE